MRTRLIAIGFVVLIRAPVAGAGQEVASRHYAVEDGLAHSTVTRVFQDSRGYIWFATADGLSRFDGHRFVTYRAADGLPAVMLTDIGETHGTLWVAARDGTAVRLNDSPRGARFFAQQIASRHAAVIEPPMPLFAGVVRRVFERHSRGRAPLVVRGTTALVTHVLEDRSGTLWIATSGSGVFAVPPEPVVTYTARDELPDEHVLRIVEARDGRIYAVTRRGGVAELKEDGVEAVPGSLFAPFDTMGRRIAQDAHGVWWFGTKAGVFSAPGPALSFSSARPVTGASAARWDESRTFVDSRGWTWEPLRGGGVSVCRDRGVVYPGCLDYTKADGIAHVVTSIAEDAFGRIYLGTAKGLVRFNADTATFRAIPSGVPLAGSHVTHCMRDSRGRMWIATTSGVSAIVPRRPQRAGVPAVYVTSLTAGGKQVKMPPRGATAWPTLRLDRATNDLQIEYVAPGVHAEGTRYQHRLLPLERDWNPPGPNLTATYSRLNPGSYQFAVRAVAFDGRTGAPATVSVTVARSLWAHWSWLFAGAATISVGAWLLRQLQRAYRRGDLAGVPLGVLGGVEQQAQDRRRHGGPADGPWLGER